MLSYASPWKMDKLIRLEGAGVERGGKFPWKFDNWRITASGHDRNLKIDHVMGEGRLKVSVELILITGVDGIARKVKLLGWQVGRKIRDN